MDRLQNYTRFFLFSWLNHRMETLEEFGSALHGIETYKYRLCKQFDQIGLPKQFQDCAYILKYTLLMHDKSIVLKPPHLFRPPLSPLFWKRRMSLSKQKLVVVKHSHSWCLSFSIWQDSWVWILKGRKTIRCAILAALSLPPQESLPCKFIVSVTNSQRYFRSWSAALLLAVSQK